MDLSTTYLGLELAHPLVASASPLSESLDGIRRLEDAGAAAVVMHSLFEEQLAAESRRLDHYLSYAADAHPEALTYFPEPETFHVGPERYLETLRRAKEAVAVPVIGSLNGVSPGGWVEYARLIEEAGADALELNVYYLSTDPTVSGAEVEQQVVEVVRAVRAALRIPLAVKLGPYYSAMAHMALQLADAGADGLVLFNRFYQPDLDLDRLEVVPNLVLSASPEMRLPLRWIAILFGRVPVDLALTTGIRTHEDVLKGLMAGACVTMMASELLRGGLGRLEEIREGVEGWMLAHEYASVRQMQGSMSQWNVEDPAAFERANYLKVLQSWRPDPAGQMPWLPRA